MTSKETIELVCNYYKKGSSLSETSELLCKNHNIILHPNTIKYHLKKSGVVLRTHKEGIAIKFRKGLNTQKLLDEFKVNSSIRDVSRKIGIDRGTIRKILIENGIAIMDSRSAQLAIGYIKEKEKSSLSPQEMAYLYGLVMGDLTPIRKSNFTVKLITHTTHKYFIELLCKTFEKYGPINHKETKIQGMFRFQTHLDLESFSFLLTAKSEKLPDWINNENFFDFLAGFLDSDGSVTLKNTIGYIFYNLRYFGQNIELLNEIKVRLGEFGFDSSIYLTHKKDHTSYLDGVIFRYNKDYYTLETRKGQTIDLLNKIPIRHPEKIMKRDLIFKIYKQNIKKWNGIEEEVVKIRKLIKIK